MALSDSFPIHPSLGQLARELLMVLDCSVLERIFKVASTGRRGKKKTIIAVGHSILVIIYHVLRDQKAYQELGGHYFETHDRQGLEKRLVRRLEKLGYEVSLTATSPAA